MLIHLSFYSNIGIFEFWNVLEKSVKIGTSRVAKDHWSVTPVYIYPFLGVKRMKTVYLNYIHPSLLCGPGREPGRRL